MKISTFQGLLVAVAVTIFSVNNAPADPVVDAQRQAAEAARKQLPMQLGDGLTWVTASSAGRTLIYGYVIDIDNNLSNDQKDYIQTTMFRNVCGTPQVRKTMKRGAEYAYLYNNARGISQLYFKIVERDCANF